jgi:hypothetical protein
MEYFLIAITAFISSLAGSYLASYVKKKGENLATTEDIDDITRKRRGGIFFPLKYETNREGKRNN